MLNIETPARKSKYSDAAYIINFCTKDKDFKEVDLMDFPAERYFVIWKISYLAEWQRIERTNYRKEIKAAFTKGNLVKKESLEAINMKYLREKRIKEKAISAVLRSTKRKSKKVEKILITHNAIMRDDTPAIITALADGGYSIKLDEKTTIHIKEGKNPQEVVDRYKSRHNITPVGSASQKAATV